MVQNHTQHNLDYFALCLHAIGVSDLVVSPGSRNAPIVAAIAKRQNIQLHSVVDERCAAFVALGMAQATQMPTAVICTSGSAVANFYPAVLEAFYQRVPLIVITADRPVELIDNWDGQAIHQQNIFAPHQIQSYSLPQNLDANDNQSKIESIFYSIQQHLIHSAFGPFHVNIPLRDPIYANVDKAPSQHPIPALEWKNQRESAANKQDVDWRIFENKRILLVCGQLPFTAQKDLQILQKIGNQIPVIADVCSNLSIAGISGWERALRKTDVESLGILQPEILVTIGTSVVSKQLKLFLRSNPPIRHLHLASFGKCGDPFFSNPENIAIAPETALQKLLDLPNMNSSYLNNWKNFVSNFQTPISQPTCDEFSVVQHCMQSNIEALHFGNSMPIRYAGLCGKTAAMVLCNRGVSGIDGCVSTAIGFALKTPNVKQVLVVGDVTFFYDSNAFWLQQLPQNLKIIVLNNGGGNIFDIIPGPGLVPQIKPYISTPHGRNAQAIAMDYGIQYQAFSGFDSESLSKALESTGLAILEFATDAQANQQFWELLDA